MGKRQKLTPALTPDAREAQLINLAMRNAEDQMLNGSASSQVITHFLKLGTERTRLEREKLQSEVALANARVEAIKAQQTSEELYQEAIAAFTTYRPNYYEEDYGDNYGPF